jgi:hypothetical protein
VNILKALKEVSQMHNSRIQDLCVFVCLLLRDLCVFITAVPIIKLFAWGEGDSGGHVLRDVTQETTSRGPCGLVCHLIKYNSPSRTSERGGGIV